MTHLQDFICRVSIDRLVGVQARVAVVQWLEEQGLFRGTAGNEMRLGTCSRSGDVIEPVIKPQWWVRCSGLGAAAAKAVHDDQLTILPSPKTFLECALPLSPG